MSFASRPLRATADDQALLCGRDDELAEVRRAVDAGLNVLVDSAPGGGRTSLVNAVAFRSSVATVVGGGGADASTLLARCVSELTGRRVGPSDDLDGLAVRLVEHLDSGGGDLRRRRAVPGVPQLVILDDAEPPALFELLRQLRDVLWDPRVVWLVTTQTQERNVVLRPPADAFFDAQMHLGALGREDALALLAARDDRFTHHHGEVTDAVGGNPRALVRALQALEAGQSSGQLAQASVRHRMQLDELSSPGQALMAALDTLGPSSASDQRLLDALGWTRARVSQVLGELRRYDLVEQGVLNQGLGRPRKVWRRRAPAEWTSGRDVA